MISEFFLFCHFSDKSSTTRQTTEGRKNLNTSTNSPLERGRGVLECIRVACFTHPLPLSRGEKVYASEILRYTPFRSG